MGVKLIAGEKASHALVTASDVAVSWTDFDLEAKLDLFEERATTESVLR